jgi:hypothetical protein
MNLNDLGKVQWQDYMESMMNLHLSCKKKIKAISVTARGDL